MECGVSSSHLNNNKDEEESPARLKATPCIAQDLLKQAEQIIKDHGNLSDEALLALHSLFGNPFEKSLELLDTDCLTYLKAPGGRYVIQVVGSSGTIYTLFPKVNFCNCQAYRYQVIGSQTFFTCKHVLAARLGEMLSKGRTIPVSDLELTRVLHGIANPDIDTQKTLP